MNIGIAHFLLAGFVHQHIEFARQARQNCCPIGGFVFHIVPQGFHAHLIVHPIHQKRLGRGPQIQIRVELAAQALDIQQRFLQQHELRLDFHIKAPAGFKQAHQHQAKRNLRQRLVENRLTHGAHRRFELFGAGVGRHPARFDVRRGHAVVVAVEKGQKVNRQIAFVVIGEAADDAEIERDIAVVVGHQNIARVHIGVEKTVFKHLGEENFHTIAGQFFQIDALRLQSGDVGNRRAVHPFDGEHIAAAIIEIHFGHNQHIAAGKLAAELAGIGRFFHQIELVVQIFVEFGHHFARLQALAIGKQALDPARAKAHQRQILLDNRQNIGAQHLHRHRFAAVQSGTVHLRHRSAGHRLDIEFGIQIGNRPP